GGRGAPAVVDGAPGWTAAERRAVDARAKQIAADSWPSLAVKAYVEEITAAIVVGATVAATSAATSG
ncbi:hypothetical protein, partial [Cellulosimicrobium cellulans]|uniref:hypothetical protein n=1 Tax=Cellulosimicrobium cellulans TaxID=1710 RepID=UPI001C0BC0CF